MNTAKRKSICRKTTNHVQDINNISEYDVRPVLPMLFDDEINNDFES